MIKVMADVPTAELSVEKQEVPKARRLAETMARRRAAREAMRAAVYRTDWRNQVTRRSGRR